jgi:hypothetical protein
MSIRFRCPNESCAKMLAVTDESEGRAGKCRWCGTAVVVPSQSPADFRSDFAPGGKPQSVPPPMAAAVSKPRRET